MTTPRLVGSPRGLHRAAVNELGLVHQLAGALEAARRVQRRVLAAAAGRPVEPDLEVCGACSGRRTVPTTTGRGVAVCVQCAGSGLQLVECS